MNGYIKKQSLMDYCYNTANKTIDNNDIARFPAAPVVEVDRVLEIVEGEGTDPDPEKDNEGCMYSEGWIECGLTIAEQIRALKEEQG